MKKVSYIFIMVMIASSIIFSQNSSERQGQMFDFESEEQVETGSQEGGYSASSDLQRKPATPLEKRINEQKYIVGPGDVFGINIYSSQNMIHSARVNPSGEVMIPTVGIIEIGEITLDSAKNRIKEAVKKHYKNAKVYIVLTNIRKFKIQITGAVRAPGTYTITPVTRLSEIVEEAGGFRQLAREFAIEVHSEKEKVAKIDYFKYLIKGDFEHNPTFSEGDKIKVPFGDFQSSGISLNGRISDGGYDLIKNGETLQELLNRKGELGKNADINNVKINRKNGEILTLTPVDFKDVNLKQGDEISILSEKGVAVNGFVQKPGQFNYYPGYTAEYYVNRAGGPRTNGSVEGVIIKRANGKVVEGHKTKVHRGDVIIVPRTLKHWLFADASILSIITSIASITLSYIAATN